LYEFTAGFRSGQSLKWCGDVEKEKSQEIGVRRRKYGWKIKTA